MAKSADLVLRMQGEDNASNSIKSVKKEIDATKKSAASLSEISSNFAQIGKSSASVSKKLASVKKQMELLAQSEQLTSEKGKKMWDELAAEARKYDAILQKIKKDTSSVKPPSGEGVDVKSLAGGLANTAGLGGATKALGTLAAMANPATIAVAAVGGTMIAAGKAAADFEVHLDALQALTGVSDKQMRVMNDTILDMSRKFGISAGEIADSMGLIGSQAPELLKDTDALALVTDAAMTLAKAGSITAEEAGKAITTVTNQMGVSASEALNIANTLEAAEQQGAASVEYLNKAIEKSGTQAKGACMSYTELVAMIETVAPKFSSADVAGSQLNSTLLKLSMGADEFNPAVVGMSKALENLNAAQLDNAALKGLVGESNITMIKTMMEGKQAFDDFSVSLSGTSAAVDAWQMKTDNMAGAIDKLKAGWDALLITLGQSGIIQGIADNIMVVMDALNFVMECIGRVVKAFEAFGESGVKSINPAKVQLDILCWAINNVCTVLEIIIRVAAKVFNYFVDKAREAGDFIGEKWEAIKKTLGDIAFVRVVVNAFNKVMDAAANMINTIKKYWNKLKEFLGMKVESNVDVKVTHTEVDTTPQTTTPTGGTGTGTGTGSKGKGKGKGNTTTKTPTVAAEEGSIKALQDRVSALNKELNETNVSDERLQQIIAEKDALEAQIKTLQQRNGLLNTKKNEAEAGSIKALTDRITELNNELNNSNVSDERLQEIIAEKAAIEEQIKQLKIRNGLQKADDPLETKRKTYNNANSAIGQVKADFKLGLISKDEAEAAINAANEMIQSIGLEPLELHINDDGTITNSMEELEAYKEKMGTVADTIGSVGNMFGSLGDAVGGTGGAILEFAGQTMGAIAQVLPQIVALITAKQGEAMAAGTASAAALPFPANLAAMASIIATVVSLFASIPKTFADGGIVSGSNFHGDSVLARVNSGEMILNKNQQANLYSTLKNGNNNGGGGQVEFVIKGSTLQGALNNYNTKQSRIR